MSWTERKALEAIGYLLIILGLLLITTFLIRAFFQTSYVCPSTPCSPSNLANVPMYGVGFLLGVALVIIGVILLRIARKMKSEE